jgi:dienelactone hydrolase
VISGVQSLIARGFVDTEVIGMAGHSWGGYQTAHLATRTNLFAAAESGAPVSNMFSAYGGIRYESGRSRQGQYEGGQSRIGETPWEAPQKYWQNSPLFYADRVQTPILILHNDNDGAVPWTNGIELFMALRRLGKEAYLFNYNGEPHGLRKRQNMEDWSRRMFEFFEHHLRGEPAPRWMTDGVPYSERVREKIPYAPSYLEGLIRGKLKPEVMEAVNGTPGALPCKKDECGPCPVEELDGLRKKLAGPEQP